MTHQGDIMPAFRTEFIGGSANSATKTITAQDLSGKPVTLTFYSGCPGTGFNVPLGTTVRLSAACYSTLETAVKKSYKVRLDGTQSDINLSAVIHSILP